MARYVAPIVLLLRTISPFRLIHFTFSQPSSSILSFSVFPKCFCTFKFSNSFEIGKYWVRASRTKVDVSYVVPIFIIWVRNVGIVILQIQSNSRIAWHGCQGNGRYQMFRSLHMWLLGWIKFFFSMSCLINQTDVLLLSLKTNISYVWCRIIFRFR